MASGLMAALPATGILSKAEAELWPVLRPGRKQGLACQQRTGSAWPVFIDGRDAAGDEAFVLGLENAPHNGVSIVRIR